jgi:Glycosyl transferase family 1
VCEAFYYRKPAILMPMPGQYEQYVNAADAERVGAGKLVPDLDPQRLEDFLPQYQPQHEAYLTWMQRGLDRLIWHLEHPLDRPTPTHHSNGAATHAESIHLSA